MYSQTFVADLPNLQDSIEGLMTGSRIPGLFLTMVTRDSVIWQGGMGTAIIDQQRLVTDTTLFKMGSVTKSFAALTVLKLVEQGKLSLSTKVSDIAPELPLNNLWQETHPVRIEHLLEHTAGIDGIHLHSYYNTREPGLSVQELIDAHKNSLFCRWKPGTRHSYTNVGYILLSYLIEKISRDPYQDLVQQTILRSLGMSHSGFGVPSQSTDKAIGYVYDTREGLREATPLEGLALAGGLQSCAQDMTQLLFFFLNQGQKDSMQIVSSASIDRMESTQTTLGARAGLDDYYGLGNTLGHSNAKITFRGHGGGVPGFRSYYAYNRELGIGYAVAINKEGGLYPIRKLIVNFLTQHIEKKGAQRPATLLNQTYVASFLGYYQFNNSKDEVGNAIDKLGGIHLFTEGDHLYMRPQPGFEALWSNRKPWKLIPISDSVYRYENINLATVALTHDSDGKKVVAMINSYYERASYARAALIRVFVFGSIIVSLSIVPFGMAWLVLWLRKKISGKEAIVRLTPAFTVGAGFVILATVGYLFVYQRFEVGSMSFSEIFIYLGSLIFPALAVVSLVLAASRVFNRKTSLLNYYLLAVGLSLCGVSIYLATAGLIGFQLWAY